MELRSRYRGAMLGLACGDALGATLEFTRPPPGGFTPYRVTDIVGGGPFDLKPGEWTDDTTMALCLAESLVRCGGFEAADFVRTLCRWRDDGHLSVKGHCFDIGRTTAAALSRSTRTGEPYSGSKDATATGNGSLIRLAPVVLAYTGQGPQAVLQHAILSSATTHAAADCLNCGGRLSAMLYAALRGKPKDAILDKWTPPEQLRASSYVRHTLNAALWAFRATDTFRDGALAVVNLGEDADSTGAVYGQLAGAFYGEEGIPPEWHAKLAMRELIERRADELLELSGRLAG